MPHLPGQGGSMNTAQKAHDNDVHATVAVRMTVRLIQRMDDMVQKVSSGQIGKVTRSDIIRVALEEYITNHSAP